MIPSVSSQLSDRMKYFFEMENSYIMVRIEFMSFDAGFDFCHWIPEEVNLIQSEYTGEPPV